INENNRVIEWFRERFFEPIASNSQDYAAMLDGLSLSDIITFVNGDVLNGNARGINKRLLKLYSQRQFKDATKGLTELVSNAIDAVESDGNVNVSVDKGNLTVENEGDEGISLKVVLLNLVNTANSTKTDKEKQIGRFGIGFFSSLAFLEKETDTMEIISARNSQSFKFVLGVRIKDGEKNYYVKEIKFISQKEARAASKTLKSSNGTSIAVKTQSINEENKADFINRVKEDFAYCAAEINIYDEGRIENGWHFFVKDEYKPIAVNSSPELAISSNNKPVKTPGAGKLVVVVKGVTFFETEILGSNAVDGVLINLPNDLNFSISRDSVTVDDKLLRYIVTLIQNVADSDKSLSEKMALLNSLYILCERFEMQKKGFVDATGIKQIAESIIEAAINDAKKEKRNLIIAPDSIESYEFFGTNNQIAVLVNPNLMMKKIYHTQEISQYAVLKRYTAPSDAIQDVISEVLEVLKRYYKTKSSAPIISVSFDNNTDYGMNTEFNKKEIIEIGGIVLVNDFASSSQSGKPYSKEKKDFTAAALHEIQEAHSRVLSDKNPKFYNKRTEQTQKASVESGEPVVNEITVLAAGKGKPVQYKGTDNILQLINAKLGIARDNQISNEISQSVHDMGQSEGAFIRELLKNSIEAKAKKIEISLNENDGILIIKDDGAGMDYEQITNELLTPKATDKSGLNNFGTGIFSVFGENVERLVIKTTKNGKTYIVNLTPVFTNDRVTNVKYEIFEQDEDNEVSGTTMEVHYKGEDKTYLSRNLKKNLNALNLGNLIISVGGKGISETQFKQNKIKINPPVGLEKTYIKLFFTEGGQSFISAHGMFVKDISVDYLIQELGLDPNSQLFTMLKWLTDKGVIIDLPPTTKLLLNKQDFISEQSQKDEIIKLLTDAAVKLYMDEAGHNVNFSPVEGIPYDYFYRGDNKLLDNHKIGRDYSLGEAKAVVRQIVIWWFNYGFSIDAVYKTLRSSKLSQEEKEKLVKDMCDYIYRFLNHPDADLMSKNLYDSIIAVKNKEELEKIIYPKIKEIIKYALNYMTNSSDERIKEYNLTEMADAIIDHSYPFQASEISIPFFSWNNIEDYRKQDKKNDNETKTSVAYSEKAEVILQNAKDRLKLSHSRGQDRDPSGKDEETIYKIAKVIIDGYVEACFGKNSGIDIEIGFYDDSSPSTAHAVNGNIGLNKISDFVFSDDFIMELLAVMLHEFTHCVENKDNETHNKSFYDLERHIMAKVLKNEEVLSSMQAKIDNILENKDIKEIVKSVFRSDVSSMFKDKNRINVDNMPNNIGGIKIPIKDDNIIQKILDPSQKMIAIIKNNKVKFFDLNLLPLSEHKSEIFAALGLNAILDQTSKKLKLQEMLAQGENKKGVSRKLWVLKISGMVALEEFAKAYMPWFFALHNDAGGKIGGAIVSFVSWAPLIALISVFAFNPIALAFTLSLSVNVLSALALGAVLNLSVHILIDYLYINKLLSNKIAGKMPQKEKMPAAAAQDNKQNADAAAKSSKAPFYSIAASQALAGIKPEKAVKTAHGITFKVVNFKPAGSFKRDEEIKLEEHLVIMKDMPSDGLLKELKSAGLKTAVLSRENPLAKKGKNEKKDWKKMSGISLMASSKTGENVKANVFYRVRNGVTEICFAAKKDFDIDSALEKFLINVKEGVRTDFKGVKTAVIAEGKKITPSDILNVIQNNFTDNDVPAVKERVLNLFESDLGAKEKFKTMCVKEYDKNGIGVFVISPEQENRYRKQIDELRKEGLKFVVRSDKINISLDGIRFNARGKTAGEIENILQKLKEAADAANGANLADGDLARSSDVRITIETDSFYDFAGLGGIWKKYGVKLVVPSRMYEAFKSACENDINMQGLIDKAEIEFDAKASSQEARKYLGETGISAISVSDSGVLFGEIKEDIYKPKNAKQRHDKGCRAALKSSFDYTADHENEEE
ncbi:MAG: ATP-binding protein, partial [Endomicrobium sp.]|nr:ATP-binding protein [Endomicrobium sp.]